LKVFALKRSGIRCSVWMPLRVIVADGCRNLLNFLHLVLAVYISSAACTRNHLENDKTAEAQILSVPFWFSKSRLKIATMR
jgi:hypothetical protein